MTKLRGLRVQVTGSACTSYGVCVYKTPAGFFKNSPDKGRKDENQIQIQGLRRENQKPKYRRKCIDSI